MSHPASNGRLFSFISGDPQNNHPASIFDISYETSQSSYYITDEVDSDEDGIDYTDDDEDDDDNDDIMDDINLKTSSQSTSKMTSTSQSTNIDKHGDDELVPSFVTSDHDQIFQTKEQDTLHQTTLDQNINQHVVKNTDTDTRTDTETDTNTDTDTNINTSPKLVTFLKKDGFNITTLIDKRKQTLFLAAHLKDLPGEYNTLLTNRIVVLHFALVGLDLLGALDTFTASPKREKIIEWIYFLQSPSGGFRGSPQMCQSLLYNLQDILISKDKQKHKDKDDTDDIDNIDNTDATDATTDNICDRTVLNDDYLPIVDKNNNQCNHHESNNENHSCIHSFLDTPIEDSSSTLSPSTATNTTTNTNTISYSHLAATHSAICSLLTLGDTLDTINRHTMGLWLQSLQQPTGGFAASTIKDEIDLRFCYCAMIITHTLQLYEYINIYTLADFILQCQTWEGGFSLVRYAEAHGGATYTAVSSLHMIRLYMQAKLQRNENQQLDNNVDNDVLDNTLLHKINTILDINGRLARWIIHNQGTGYRGRVNKSRDCCYSYWLGSSLAIIQGDIYTNPEENIKFNLQCAGAKGGFAKDPQSRAEILHSYTSLCGISLASTARKRIQLIDDKVMIPEDISLLFNSDYYHKSSTPNMNISTSSTSLSSTSPLSTSLYNTLVEYEHEYAVGVKANDLRMLCPIYGIAKYAVLRYFNIPEDSR